MGVHSTVSKSLRERADDVPTMSGQVEGRKSMLIGFTSMDLTI